MSVDIGVGGTSGIFSSRNLLFNPKLAKSDGLDRDWPIIFDDDGDGGDVDIGDRFLLL